MKSLRYTVPFVSAILGGTFSFADELSRLPDAAVKLQNAYNQSIEVASKPIRERYLADLKTLQEQSTRAAKLDDALALKREIERVTVRAILGKWKELPEGTGTITIDADGTAHNSNGASAVWEIRGGDIILPWSNGYKHIFPFSEMGDNLHGKLLDPQGKSHPWSATRIR